MAKAGRRRLPLDEVFIKDKKVSDLVYGKFQIESKFTEKGEARIMERVKLNKSQWAKDLGLSRPTLDTKIKYLKKVKLIVDKGDYFEIPEFGKTYFLIPDATLRFLVNTGNADVIKIYSHLGALWALDKTEASFTQRQLLTTLGYAANKADNHKKVEDILCSLVNNGLIEYREVKKGRNVVKFLTKFSHTHKKRV